MNTVKLKQGDNVFRIMPSERPLDTIVVSLKERAATLLKQLEGYKTIENELRLVTRALKVLAGESLGKPTGRTLGAKLSRPPKMTKTQTLKGHKGASRNAVELILQAHPKGMTLKELQVELAEKANIKLATGGVYSTMRDMNNIKKTLRGNIGVYSLK